MADRIGLGTILKVNDGSSGAQTEILYVLQMPQPAPEIEFASSTYLNQGSRIRKVKPVMTEPGETEFIVKHDATERARMIVLHVLTLNATTPIFQILFTDSVTYTFDAWVKKVSPVIVIDQIEQYTVTLKLNSLITVA